MKTFNELRTEGTPTGADYKKFKANIDAKVKNDLANKKLAKKHQVELKTLRKLVAKLEVAIFKSEDTIETYGNVMSYERMENNLKEIDNALESMIRMAKGV